MSLLLELLRERIKDTHTKTISFYEYMNTALYHPQFGYYNQPKTKIGKHGDFYTSTSVGGVFGEVLGHVVKEKLVSLPQSAPRYLIEFGGGNGGLIHDILHEWKETFPSLEKEIRVVLIEKSPYHRKLQQEKLVGFGNIEWYESWEQLVEAAGSVSGVIISNELLDAFPVYLLERTDQGWYEIRVGWNEVEGKLEERPYPLADPQLLAYVGQEEPYIEDLTPFRLEVNVDAGSWLSSLASGLTDGYIITIDYGYLRSELYTPQHRQGTVMCYKNHLVYEDPFLFPGAMDMTSHVNFSYLMDEGKKAGLQNLAYSSQSQFLIGAGILDYLQNHQETDPFGGVATKRNRAIRQLVMPGGMGDQFRVLVQRKQRSAD
jgi:SAM-dependent MidA family methyltransferase